MNQHVTINETLATHYSAVRSRLFGAKASHVNKIAEIKERLEAEERRKEQARLAVEEEKRLQAAKEVERKVVKEKVSAVPKARNVLLRGDMAQILTLVAQGDKVEMIGKKLRIYKSTISKALKAYLTQKQMIDQVLKAENELWRKIAKEYIESLELGPSVYVHAFEMQRMDNKNFLDQVFYAIRMGDDKASSVNIARAFNKCQSTVQRALERQAELNGTKLPKINKIARWTVTHIAKAEKMWAEGLTTSQIGAALGCSKNTICAMASIYRSRFPTRVVRKDAAQ